MAPRSELPLELRAEVITADGVRYRWGSNDPLATNRFQNLSFSTKVGEGFSSGSLTLPRQFNRDSPDLSLVDTVVLTGADGSVAYEGRNSAMPREVGADAHQVSITLAGWMANAADKKVREIFVDRDTSAWTGMSLGRQATLLTADYTIYDGSASQDVTGQTAAFVTAIEGAWTAGIKPVAEGWYDCGPGVTIARIWYSWLNQDATTISPSDTNWSWIVGTSSDDKGTVAQSSGNLRAAGPSTSIFTPSSPMQFAFLELLYNNTPAGGDGVHFGIAWYNLAVYGATGVPTYSDDPTQPNGVRASDVIRNVVTRFCPQLQVGTITPVDYVISNLAFKDLTTPLEMMQQANKYHLFNLAVWEDRTFYWTPFDLSDYDWQVRAGIDAEVSLQGQSTDNVYNGITVSYNDLLTGVQNTLQPDTHPELVDANPDNPWNRHSVDHWADITLNWPHLEKDALQAGRAALADYNRPKSPGSITVHGYIRDRAGNWQPGWRPRAGDTVAIVNHPNDAPRLIQETSWDDDAKTLTLSVDAPPAALDAQQDRVMTALKARGLI